jgi:hypothetical protein
MMPYARRPPRELRFRWLPPLGSKAPTAPGWSGCYAIVLTHPSPWNGSSRWATTSSSIAYPSPRPMAARNCASRPGTDRAAGSMSYPARGLRHTEQGRRLRGAIAQQEKGRAWVRPARRVCGVRSQCKHGASLPPCDALARRPPPPIPNAANASHAPAGSPARYLLWAVLLARILDEPAWPPRLAPARGPGCGSRRSILCPAQRPPRHPP